MPNHTTELTWHTYSSDKYVDAILSAVGQSKRYLIVPTAAGLFFAYSCSKQDNRNTTLLYEGNLVNCLQFCERFEKVLLLNGDNDLTDEEANLLVSLPAGALVLLRQLTENTVHPSTCQSCAKNFDEPTSYGYRDRPKCDTECPYYLTEELRFVLGPDEVWLLNSENNIKRQSLSVCHNMRKLQRLGILEVVDAPAEFSFCYHRFTVSELGWRLMRLRGLPSIGWCPYHAPADCTTSQPPQLNPPCCWQPSQIVSQHTSEDCVFGVDYS